MIENNYTTAKDTLEEKVKELEEAGYIYDRNEDGKGMSYGEFAAVEDALNETAEEIYKMYAEEARKAGSYEREADIWTDAAEDLKDAAEEEGYMFNCYMDQEKLKELAADAEARALDAAGWRARTEGWKCYDAAKEINDRYNVHIEIEKLAEILQDIEMKTAVEWK